MAKRVLKRFGDLNHVLAAPPPRLRRWRGGREGDLRAEANRSGGAPHGAGRMLNKPILSFGGRAVAVLPDGDGPPRSGTVPGACTRRKNVLDRRRGAGRRHGRSCARLPGEVVKRALELKRFCPDPRATTTRRVTRLPVRPIWNMTSRSAMLPLCWALSCTITWSWARRESSVFEAKDTCDNARTPLLTRCFPRRPKDPRKTPAPADKAAEAPKGDQPIKQKPKAA